MNTIHNRTVVCGLRTGRGMTLLRARVACSTVPGAASIAGAARVTGLLTTCMHSQSPMISFHNPGIICTGIPYTVPEFHIHVPCYCAYEELRAAGDSGFPGPSTDTY